jgi:predicted amidohydrolase YtcJ
MDYDIVITNGTLLSADGETKADVAIRGETIAAVGPDLAARARACRDH